MNRVNLSFAFFVFALLYAITTVGCRSKETHFADRGFEIEGRSVFSQKGGDTFVTLVDVQEIPNTGIGRVIIKRMRDNAHMSAFVSEPFPAKGTTVIPIGVHVNHNDYGSEGFVAIVEQPKH